MNELTPADKTLVVNALLRLIGPDVLTPLEKRDILHEITAKLTSFNIADIVSETNNRRRLLLKNIESDQGYTGLPRELVFDPATKTIKIFGPTSADDTTIGAAPDIDIEALLAGMDYVTLSASGLSGTNYINGWYRKYKSGWVEQGFRSTANRVNITFPVAMKNTSYHMLVSSTRQYGGSAGGVLGGCYLLNATATTVQTVVNNAAGGNLIETDFYPFVEIKGFFA